MKFEDRWFQALIDEKDVDCVEVQYVGFSEDESFETIEKAQWITRIRSPQPHLHLYGLTKLKLKWQDISAHECHTFRNFGYVGSHLQAIAAIEEQLEAGEGLPRVAASDLVAACAPGICVNKRLFAFKNTQAWPPYVSCNCLARRERALRKYLSSRAAKEEKNAAGLSEGAFLFPDAESRRST